MSLLEKNRSKIEKICVISDEFPQFSDYARRANFLRSIVNVDLNQQQRNYFGLVIGFIPDESQLALTREFVDLSKIAPSPKDKEFCEKFAENILKGKNKNKEICERVLRVLRSIYSRANDPLSAADYEIVNGTLRRFNHSRSWYHHHRNVEFQILCKIYAQWSECAVISADSLSYVKTCFDHHLKKIERFNALFAVGQIVYSHGKIVLLERCAHFGNDGQVSVLVSFNGTRSFISTKSIKKRRQSDAI